MKICTGQIWKYTGDLAQSMRPGILPYVFILSALVIFITACNWAGETGSFCEASKTRSTDGKNKHETTVVTDLNGRTVQIPSAAEKVICSGPGTLRLLTYLNAQDQITAVDGIEVRGAPIDARPYAIANPQFKEYPIFGEFRGFDNPELIAALDARPDVIFKMAPGGGIEPDQLQDKTGIPVITLQYGNLTYDYDTFKQALNLMAGIMGQQARAQEVIAYIDASIADLQSRIDNTSEVSCYIGGLGQSGPHGIQSTNPAYAPFRFLGIQNAASVSNGSSQRTHLNVSKEHLILSDPDIIFIDTSTLRLPGKANALEQLQHDPAFAGMQAVRNARVYGLFPNNSYNENIEVVLANAYYIGKIVYPENFPDIDPMEKAEEIARFFNGGPAFREMNLMFDHTGFSKLNIQ
ncbi:MAG: ABC transporter substrate-binding protein [Bacteroidales bacterium]